MLSEQALDPALHDRGSFRCGEPVLDAYLQKYAVQQNAKGVSSVFVLVDTRTPQTILGYYTLSAAQVGADQLSAAERKKLLAELAADDEAAMMAIMKAIAREFG